MFALPRPLLRVEGLVLIAASLALYFHLGFGWLVLAVLLFVPDVSLLAYLGGKRAGVAAYNLTHTVVWPVVLGTAGILAGVHFVEQVALVWLVHIGNDRLLGFGLKYPDRGFWDTHVQRL